MHFFDWERLGIASRLSAITILILLSAGLFLFGVTVHQITNATDDDMAIRMKGRLTWLSGSCREPAITGDFAVIEEVLEEHAKLIDARAVSFGDVRGNRMRKVGTEPALSAPTWFVQWLAIKPNKNPRSKLRGIQNSEQPQLSGRM